MIAWFEDLSDEDGPFFRVEDEFGTIGEFFDRAEAEWYLAGVNS